VTSGTRAIATHRLRHTGLPVPDVMVCAEDVRAGKPDPEGYLLAAARLGHDPAACVVIEDAPPGIEAARAGKIPSIGVAQTYPARALAAADLVVARLADLRVSRSGGRLRLYHEGADPGAAPRHREETDR
jgi:sugar-phosphatase